MFLTYCLGMVEIHQTQATSKSTKIGQAGEEYATGLGAEGAAGFFCKAQPDAVG